MELISDAKINVFRTLLQVYIVTLYIAEPKVMQQVIYLILCDINTACQKYS